MKADYSNPLPMLELMLSNFQYDCTCKNCKLMMLHVHVLNYTIILLVPLLNEELLLNEEVLISLH